MDDFSSVFEGMSHVQRLIERVNSLKQEVAIEEPQLQDHSRNARSRRQMTL